VQKNFIHPRLIDAVFAAGGYMFFQLGKLFAHTIVCVLINIDADG
jgi:hypothetical protein